MARRRRAIPRPDATDVDTALDAMDADQLRDLVRDVLPWLDDRAHSRVVNDIIDRAARAGSGWTPDGPTSESVAAIVAFAEAAKRTSVADAAEADGYLRECERGMFLGAVGKWAIHPSQVELAQKAFTPDPEIVERARKMNAAYLKAVENGKGAAQVDGFLVDAATMRLYGKVLEMADRIGI